MLTVALAGGEGPSVTAYWTLAEVSEEDYSPADYRLLKLAFQAGPSRVLVLRASGQEAEAFALLEMVKYDWLAAPGLDQDKAISLIKGRRAKGVGVKLVAANALSPDHEGIVNLCASDLVLTDGPIEARDYAVRVAGLLAALTLTRSATYAALPEVVSSAAAEDPDKAVDAGKLILVRGQDGYKQGRGVNSFVSTTVDKATPFQKIKIMEGIDLIRTDIARAFENSYIDRVLNDYDNKLLLVTAINAYPHGLEGDVLDKTADNRYPNLPGRPADLSGGPGHGHRRHEGRGHPPGQHRQRGVPGREADLLRHHGGPVPPYLDVIQGGRSIW